ncbi:ERI1 exoribonuclease 3-like [Branchiostoma floridae]|uniref:ERI1 exoribonuclease 3-like n=1 Tax=Branchiostoma floridae TaxID=7739 RepID=A0A9J7MEF7_BRAFL|nr:ERI1 exoribonuclease 3-like [Branchiostoma floridae]
METCFRSVSKLLLTTTLRRLSFCRYMAQAQRHAPSANTPTHGSKGVGDPPHGFDYFLVLDFEATCDNKNDPRPQEIIEFPVLKVSGRTFETEATFHTYVTPDVHPQLTPFCTELTGIIQDMVDGQPSLTQTLKDFDTWMVEQGLLTPGVSSVFVTCGDWDLRKMLPSQCSYLNIPVPSHFKQWINIKKSYSQVTGHWGKSMMMMLRNLKLEHQGRHHSGIDDCRNIARILGELARRGAYFQVTSWR